MCMVICFPMVFCRQENLTCIRTGFALALLTRSITICKRCVDCWLPFNALTIADDPVFYLFPAHIENCGWFRYCLNYHHFCRLCTWKISSTLFNTPNIHGGCFLLSSQAFAITTTLIGFTSDLRIHIRKPPSTFRATTTEMPFKFHFISNGS